MNFLQSRQFGSLLMSFAVLFSSVFALFLLDQAEACHPAFPVGISPYVGPVGVVNPNDWATVKPQLMDRVKRKGAKETAEEKATKREEKSDQKKGDQMAKDTK
ncbi:hypothetical protein niasHS_010196 [Heterodera schachtii]|uniref:Gland protein n=1 Tax=Heterodera schachtii TaxID=97005 RepID=A0ABD2J3C4_HETSC